MSLHHSKKWCLTFFLAITVSACSSTPPATENKIDLADHFLTTLEIESLWQARIETAMQELPVAKRDLLQDAINKHLDMQTLRDASKKSIEEHFSENEIKFLIDIALQPMGRSVIEKLNLYSKDMEATLTQETARAVQQHFKSF